jgi:membrane peptidoglycan carboxypeptidase
LGQPVYCPVNYDGSFHGLIQARFALGNSYNIPAVRVLALNGLDNFVNFAKEAGISTFSDPSNYGLSLTLGGGEVRPYDMATAFGVFANGGIKILPVSILKVEDWKGKVLEETNLNEIEGDRVLPEEVTYLISHILYDNNARAGAFGESSFLNVRGHPEVSVKTGTTNDRRDNWTIGFTPQALVVSWVGNNDNSEMSGAVSGVSGASPIWNRIMQETLKKAEDGFYNSEDKGHAWPNQPEGIIGRNICATTGQIPPGPDDNPGCPIRFEYFLKDSLPPAGGEVRQDIQIDKSNGQLAFPDTLPEFIETQNHPIYTDPLGTLYCLDCPIASRSATLKYPL